MDKREKKGLAIGAVIGAVAGVVGGILFAPKSGKETRQDIKNIALKTAHSAHDEAHEVLDKTKSLSSKVAKSASAHVQKVQSSAANLKTVIEAFKKGKASDKDLDSAVKKVREAQSALKAFLKK